MAKMPKCPFCGERLYIQKTTAAGVLEYYADCLNEDCSFPFARFFRTKEEALDDLLNWLEGKGDN